MKYVLSFLGVGIVILALCLFAGEKKDLLPEESVRIHVVANSNSDYDKEVKYFVKDVVVEFLSSELEDFKSSKEVLSYLKQNMFRLQQVVDIALKEKKVDYLSNISIVNEKMPARVYGNEVFEEGTYDSIKIQLGQGKGDNWWCVVFPSVCFIPSENFSDLEYKSKIWDILTNVL